MNLENLDLLSQKIESMLETLRRLKSEKADLDKVIASQNAELETLRASDAEKAARIESLESQLASRDEKIAEMDGIVSEQGVEIQNAREKFQNLLSTIESELGTEISVQSPETEKAPEQPEENSSREESAQGDFFA